MYPSRLRRAPRVANCSTALESTYAASGAVPPAICVVSLVVELSAETFWNLMVTLGCSSWNWAASFFICGESPTHEENVMVTGLAGSVGTIGLIVWPGDLGWALLVGVAPPLTQADPMSATTATAPASGPPG